LKIWKDRHNRGWGSRPKVDIVIFVYVVYVVVYDSGQESLFSTLSRSLSRSPCLPLPLSLALCLSVSLCLSLRHAASLPAPLPRPLPLSLSPSLPLPLSPARSLSLPRRPCTGVTLLASKTVGLCLGASAHPGGGACSSSRVTPVLYRGTAQRLRSLSLPRRPAPHFRHSPWKVHMGLIYRGTSLIRTPPPVGPYSSPMPRDLW